MGVALPPRCLHAQSPFIADDYVGKVKVGNLDIDDSPQTARKYGIRSVPTLLVFRGGTKVAQHVGMVSREMILKLLGLA